MSVKYLAKNTETGILEEIKFNEWQEIINNNLKLPLTQRRFFMKDVIKEANHLDEIYIEVSHKEYKKWNSENTSKAEKLKYKENFTFKSLDENWQDFNKNESDLDFKNLVTTEDISLDNLTIYEIRKKLREWKPWAEDMFEEYLKGNRRECTNDLAIKYGVSKPTIRTYKRDFGKFLKNILN